MAGENTPFMPAAIKIWARQFLIEFLPALELPMKDLELLNIMAQIRHVFGGESFLWETREKVSDIRRAWRRVPGKELTVENGYDLFSLHGRVMRIVWLLFDDFHAVGLRLR